MKAFFDTKILRARKALILDFDDTIALPARKENGLYDIQADGHIDARHLDQEKFRSIVSKAITNHIPIYIVTGRPNIAPCVNLLHSFIESVGGFHSGIGGFKKDSFYFTSSMVEKDGKLIRVETTSKAQIIKTIHQNRHPELPAEAFLFVDDLETYLIPVKELGYGTHQANPISLSHFDLIEEFLASITAPVIKLDEGYDAKAFQ